MPGRLHIGAWKNSAALWASGLRVVDLRAPGHALLFLHHPRRDILVFLNFDHPASRTLPDDHFVGGFNLLHHLCRGCVDDWRRSRSGESGAKHQPHCATHYCTSRRSFSPLAHFDENGRVDLPGLCWERR